ILIGVPETGAMVPLDVWPLVTAERVIRGSSYGSARTREDLPRLANLYLAGKLQIDQLITRRYDLGEANEAFPALVAGELARRLIVFGRRGILQEQGRDQRMANEIKYARSGDVHIAYRVFGDGPRDLVLIPGTLSHAEIFWEFPINQSLLKRFMSFARVIVFDKRGQGLSDRVGEQTLEARIGDVRAVMDAVGSARATIFGWSEGGSMSLMFSATFPERTSALVLCGSFASIAAGPWAIRRERWDKILGLLETRWGQGVL